MTGQGRDKDSSTAVYCQSALASLRIERRHVTERPRYIHAVVHDDGYRLDGAAARRIVAVFEGKGPGGGEPANVVYVDLLEWGVPQRLRVVADVWPVGLRVPAHQG